MVSRGQSTVSEQRTSHQAQQTESNALPEDFALISPGMLVAPEKALQQGEGEEGRLWYQNSQRPSQRPVKADNELFSERSFGSGRQERQVM